MNRLENAALLVIDVQNGFAGEVFGFEAAMKGIHRLLDSARQAGLPVIYTQEMHRADGIDFGRELDGAEGIHCLEGTKDVDLLGALTPRAEEYRVVKRRYSAFFATDLELLLKGLGVRTLVVCGFLTDVCVHYTCVDAHQHNYVIRVAEDAVSGSSPKAHEAALEAIRYLQRDAVVTSDELVSSLVADGRI